MRKVKQTCCFTGHRTIPECEYQKIQKHLDTKLRQLIYQGVRYFGAGGALGFDTTAVLTVLKLKHEFPHLRLILVLPCKEQTKGWNEKDIKIYNQIRDEADKVVYVSEHYHRSCMHVRNRHLVDNSSVCICYLTKKSGGTAYTVDYARRKELTIINLAQS